MRLDYRKGLLAGAWIMTAGVIGVMGNVTSMAAGALLLGLGLVPPLLLMCGRPRAIRATQPLP